MFLNRDEKWQFWNPRKLQSLFTFVAIDSARKLRAVSGESDTYRLCIRYGVSLPTRICDLRSALYR